MGYSVQLSPLKVKFRQAVLSDWMGTLNFLPNTLVCWINMWATVKGAVEMLAHMLKCVMMSHDLFSKWDKVYM